MRHYEKALEGAVDWGAYVGVAKILGRNVRYQHMKEAQRMDPDNAASLVAVPQAPTRG